MPPLGSLGLRVAGGDVEATGGPPPGTVLGPDRQTEQLPSTSPAQSLPGKGEAREKGEEEKAVPFVLGEGIPPVPARLVARIWRGEFVDMADLLRDNLEVERRRIGGQGTTPHQGHTKTLRREVPDVLSWV